MPMRAALLGSPVANWRQLGPPHGPSIISYIDPKHLMTIRITCRKLESSVWEVTSLDISDLVELDQFKAAKKVNLRGCKVSIPVEKLFHLSFVKINLGPIKFEDFKLLKEEFFKQPHMKHFVIDFSPIDDFQEYLDYLGPRSSMNQHVNQSLWYFNIDGSNTVVSIEMYECFFSFCREVWTEKLAENFILY